MPEGIVRCSALEAVYASGISGVAAGEDPGVLLSEHRPGAILHLAGTADDPAFASSIEGVLGVGLPTEAGRVTEGDGVAALWLAPTRWLVTSEGRDGRELEGALRHALEGSSSAVNDVSSGRTVIRIAGSRARDLLSKGCPLDLHPVAFGNGQCAQSLLGQITVLLHATNGGVRIDLYVARGLAVSLWEFLTERAFEFGYEVLPATWA